MVGIKNEHVSNANHKINQAEKRVIFKALNHLRTDLDGVESYVRDGDPRQIDKQMDQVMDDFEEVLVLVNLYVGSCCAREMASMIDPDKLIGD